MEVSSIYKLEMLEWAERIKANDSFQITGQRKKEDSGDGGVASNFAGLRPPYW